MKAVKHFKTITKHRHTVMKYCFKVGLYKQGLLHDLSKYTYTEFGSGVKYYQGDRSPNSAEREAVGFSLAWLHHKGRNKHHYEYWIDFGKDSSQGLKGMRMPDKYIVEMFIDRMAACKTYYGDNYKDDSALKYYNKNKKVFVKTYQDMAKMYFLNRRLVILRCCLKHIKGVKYV